VGLSSAQVSSPADTAPPAQLIRAAAKTLRNNIFFMDRAFLN
jgi:hypothetical protein